MEHHEFIVAAACDKDDGEIFHSGTLGPFIRKDGQSWADMMENEVPQKTAPSVMVTYSQYNGHRLVIHTQGVGYNHDTSTLDLGFNLGAALGVAIKFVVVPLLVKVGILGAALTGGASLGVSALALAGGLIVAAIVDKIEADYALNYQRAIILECRKDSSGEYFVHRLKESKANPWANICYSFKTLDSGKESSYYLEIDDGSDQVDDDGFAENYVTVIEPKFVIQKEDCVWSSLTQGELGPAV
jgi:hypothetical protein